MSLLLLVGAACNRADSTPGSSETSAAVTETTNTTATETAVPRPSALSGEAKRSAFEGLPVPVEATPDARNADRDWTYYLPPTVSLKELDDWYHRHLPDFANWRDWTWCRTKPLGMSIERVWHRPGSTSVMAVVIGKIDAEERGESFIYLSGDESGPASCDE